MSEAPVLLDFPDHFETERLLIRAPRPGDGQIVYESVQESLSALRAWPASLPWAMYPPSLEASETFCRTGYANFLSRTDLPMLVFLKAENKHIGNTGLHRIDWRIPKFEIGYWTRSSYARQGLMTEAVTGLIQFAQITLGARRLEILSDEQNHASRALAERVGMRLEGILHNERITPDGELRNTCVYAIAETVCLSK